MNQLMKTIHPMKNLKTLLAFMLVAVSLCLVTVPVFAEESGSGTATITSKSGGNVNVRVSPSTSAKLAPVGTLPVNTNVALTARDTDSSNQVWYKIKRNSDVGWVHSDYLKSLLFTPSSGGGSGILQPWEARYGTGNLSTAGGNSTPQQIKNFQADLESFGYNLGKGGVDGYYGTDTKNAVKQFQTNNNLTPVDGIAGPATKSKLYYLTD